MRGCVLVSYKATKYPFSHLHSFPMYIRILFCANFTMQDLSKNANLRLDVRMKQSHAAIHCCISKTGAFTLFFFFKWHLNPKRDKAPCARVNFSATGKISALNSHDKSINRWRAGELKAKCQTALCRFCICVCLPASAVLVLCIQASLRTSGKCHTCLNPPAPMSSAAEGTDTGSAQCQLMCTSSKNKQESCVIIMLETKILCKLSIPRPPKRQFLKFTFHFSDKDHFSFLSSRFFV